MFDICEYEILILAFQEVSGISAPTSKYPELQKLRTWKSIFSHSLASSCAIVIMLA